MDLVIDGEAKATEGGAEGGAAAEGRDSLGSDSGSPSGRPSVGKGSWGDGEDAELRQLVMAEGWEPGTPEKWWQDPARPWASGKLGPSSLLHGRVWHYLANKWRKLKQKDQEENSDELAEAAAANLGLSLSYTQGPGKFDLATGTSEGDTKKGNGEEDDGLTDQQRGKMKIQEAKRLSNRLKLQLRTVSRVLDVKPNTISESLGFSRTTLTNWLGGLIKDEDAKVAIAIREWLGREKHQRILLSELEKEKVRVVERRKEREEENRRKEQERLEREERKEKARLAKIARGEAEKEGAVLLPLPDLNRLPRGLRLGEFKTYFEGHAEHTIRDQWNTYLETAQRVAIRGQALGADAPKQTGKRVLVVDTGDRGVVTGSQSGFFIVNIGKGDPLKRRGYDLILADTEDQILGRELRDEPVRTYIPHPPRPQPPKPTGTDVADKIWDQKKRGVEWVNTGGYQLPDRDASLVVIDSWGMHWHSKTGADVTAGERERYARSVAQEPRTKIQRVQAGEGRPAHNHPDSYVPPVAPGAAHKCQVGVLYLVNGSRRISDGKAWRCEHNRQPSQCPLCGGIGVCEHGRRRSVCMQCAKEGKRVAVRTAVAANRPFQ